MGLTQEDIIILKKKYHGKLGQLRLDIMSLQKIGRRTAAENIKLSKLLMFRATYTDYGGLAYNTQEYLELLKTSLKRRKL